MNSLIAAATFAAATIVAGCGAHIGDQCKLSTDCSTQGTRLCDTSEPGGYCTVYNCGPDDAGNACPDNAVCVDFNQAIPGCPYSDRSPAPTAIPFCMKACEKDSDCREAEGYECHDPRQPPWNAAIVANNQGQKVCITIPDQSASDAGFKYDYDASVCWANWPDAGFDFSYDGAVDGGSDASADAADDAQGDAGTDAATDGSFADANVDAGLTDAATDGTLADSGTDATLTDGGVDSGTDANADAASDAGGTDADTTD